jgi:hypothetical protein
MAGEVIEVTNFFGFGCFGKSETIIGTPRRFQGLRGEILQKNCLSSENLKEEI